MSYFAPNLSKDKHQFFNNCGGVSRGKYSSLNINLLSQDNKDNIKKNLQTIASNFGLDAQNIFWPNQVHSADVVFINTPSIKQITADACVTNQKDILLLVSTADCTPVLLKDDVAGIIGAAHAGWRGAFNGVVENTIDLMIKHGATAKNISVALGPSIKQSSFEVKEDLYQTFINQSDNNKTYFKKNASGYNLDLSSYIIDKIKSKGITNISTSDIDTYTNLDYFSFRRNTHQGLITTEKDFPIQASVIRL